MNFIGFETAIKTYLDNLAEEDEAFAKSYQKPNKSISECCKYICQEVERNRNGAKCVACSDQEVYGLAIHYYDEDDIVVKGSKSAVTAVAAPQSEAKDNEIAPIAEKVCKPKAKRGRRKTVQADPDIPEALEIPLF